jgi:hypothetical protein
LWRGAGGLGVPFGEDFRDEVIDDGLDGFGRHVRDPWGATFTVSQFDPQP